MRDVPVQNVQGSELLCPTFNSRQSAVLYQTTLRISRGHEVITLTATARGQRRYRAGCRSQLQNPVHHVTEIQSARCDIQPRVWLMIRASHFDGDDEVFDVVLFDRQFESQHRESKTAAVVFDAGRLREHFTIEIGEPPCGASFGIVDGDDAKLLRPDGLDTLLNNFLRSAAYRLLKFLRSTAITLCPSFSGCNHFNCLPG